MRLIDADALVPDICDAEIEYGTKPVHYSANAIDLAPTIDAVPVVRGRWIPDGNTVCCSECKTLGSPQWKGCPVCLARMDGADK